MGKKTKVRPAHDATLTLRFGATVKFYRQSLGLSQEELAWRADMHRTYLADIERGTRNVSLSQVVALVHALHITVPEFFTTLEQQFKSAGEAGAPKVARLARKNHRGLRSAARSPRRPSRSR